MFAQAVNPRIDSLNTDVTNTPIGNSVSPELSDPPPAAQAAKALEVKTLHRDESLYLTTALTAGGLFLAFCLGTWIFVLSHRRKQQYLALRNQRLLRQKQVLESRYAEQQRLVQMVVHDLQSPLGKSQGLLELLLSSGPVTSEQRYCGQLLQKVNEDASALIKDLLTLYREEPAQAQDCPPQTFNAVALLQELEEESRESARSKGIELVLDLPSHPLCLQVRADYLKRILDNLLSNALKFSPLDRQVEMGVQVRDQVEFWVRDQGPGISQEDQKRLYHRFARLSARPTGGESSTGLGLAIVRELVEQMGGEIHLESQVGMGSTFKLAFPLEMHAPTEPACPSLTS